MTEERIDIVCADGVELGGHWWPNRSHQCHGAVIVTAATGVRSRYYHRYAAFLSSHGFHALTFDYRGIGLSRPVELETCRYDWTQWGERDIEAALGFAAARAGALPLLMVGHSIGGFLPGYARSAVGIKRMLTVGAQYAYWRDYAADHRCAMLFKWHLAMPLLALVRGYFPGERLGWLEDLPAGVAYEWAFRRSRIEARLGAAAKRDLVTRFKAFSAPILAVSLTDDPFATRKAVCRALSYYGSATHSKVMLEPADFGKSDIGHFGLFHDRHAAGFWLDTLLWLRDGINPWPQRVYA